ncbi:MULTISPECIES: hypothetical protein [Corynebacterium]|uniref:hypothetical protein n=1 Tax=Corynebacterium TaxID=1716 RepID=UPI002648BF16|nr:hypothetical protein [Corynebacterium sp.]MDN6283270.1 hypothetical protein [Corynebacterium sp.]MDN6368763.1 hypothetical protein [Corynebacterium sp.]MDN6405888.1 hypothetical protein [Corynebacterium sp.]
MKLYPYARLNHHEGGPDHVVALFSSSPSKRTAAFIKSCSVDRTEDLDGLLAAAWEMLGAELPIDGVALSRLCLDAYTAVGGDDQLIRPGDAEADRSPGSWATWLQAADGEFYQFRVDISHDKWSESSVPELISVIVFSDPLPGEKKSGWAYPRPGYNLTGEPVRPFRLH